MKKKKRFSNQKGVDADVYYKTMTLIQSLKPSAADLASRCPPGHAWTGSKTAAQPDGSEADREERDEERQSNLPPMETPIGGEKTRESVMQRWQTAVAAVIAGKSYSTSNSESVYMATGNRPNLLRF